MTFLSGKGRTGGRFMAIMMSSTKVRTCRTFEMIHRNFTSLVDKFESTVDNPVLRGGDSSSPR